MSRLPATCAFASRSNVQASFVTLLFIQQIRSTQFHKINENNVGGRRHKSIFSRPPRSRTQLSAEARSKLDSASSPVNSGSTNDSKLSISSSPTDKNNSIIDNVEGDKLSDANYTPRKRLPRPTLREMWELMSDIFVPTANSTDILTRYHTKAKLLYEDKLTEAQNSKIQTRLTALNSEADKNNGNNNNNTSSKLYQDTPKTSLYESLADTKSQSVLYTKLLDDSSDEIMKLTSQEKQGINNDDDDMYAIPIPSPSTKKNSNRRNMSNNAGTAEFMSFLDDPQKTSNTLYWPCGSLSFLKSDFLRILPSKQVRAATATSTTQQRYLSYTDSFDSDLDSLSSNSNNKFQNDECAQFQLIRNRDPKTLMRWIGYYLIFPTRAAAIEYYTSTLGADICGLQVRFRFVDSNKSNINPPILSQIPGVSRSMCALVSGLPSRYSPMTMAKILWDFDLLPNENESIIKLLGTTLQNEKGEGKYMKESVWLLRFQNEDEPRRLVRSFHKQYWPGTNLVSNVEILD